MARVLQEVEHGQGGKGGYRNGSGAAVTNFSALNQNAPKRRRERERESESYSDLSRSTAGEGRGKRQSRSFSRRWSVSILKTEFLSLQRAQDLQMKTLWLQINWRIDFLRMKQSWPFDFGFDSQLVDIACTEDSG